MPSRRSLLSYALLPGALAGGLPAVDLAAARSATPDLVGIDGWLNTNGPLMIAGLRGKVVLVEFCTYTCIEVTGRFAAELGYHVTLVKDATAAFSPEAMHAAHTINGPTYAHAITTTGELIAELRGNGSRSVGRQQA